MDLVKVHRVLHSDQDNTKDMQEHQCKKGRLRLCEGHSMHGRDKKYIQNFSRKT
jgi:hypothetical protein